MSQCAIFLSRLLAGATIALAVCLVLEGSTLGAQSPVTDPRVADALNAGEASLKARKWEDALGAFKQANELAEKSSAAALFGMARAYHGLGAFKNEAASCLDALKLVGSDQVMEANLRNQRGMALYSLAKKNTDKVLKDAEAEFRTALQLPGSGVMTHFNLGMTMLRLGGRDDEGLEHLNTAVTGGLKSPQLEMAKRAIDNPRRAREAFAPDFSLTTRAGEFITNTDLVGKTVLLDFWGTWCPPCRAATPGLISLYKKFAGPSFEMIGISSDTAADKSGWMNYIDENKMLWPQHLDISRRILDAYEINGYPTYIVIDPEGIVRLRREVYSVTYTMADLEAAVRRSIKGGK